MPRIMTGLFFLFAISVYYPAYAAVTVVESTPSRLVLNWEISGFDTTSYSGFDGIRTQLSFDGGYVEMGDSGAPLLLGYSIYAGVPPQGAVRVSVEPEETAVMRLANPLRRRTSAPDALSPVYSSASAWISEPSYTRMRDYRAVYLALRPVNTAGQGSIRVLRKARIVIDFPAASNSGASWEPRGDYERMVKRLLLNFSAAQGWQDGRRGLRKTAAEREPYPFTVGQPLASFRVGDGHRNGNEASTKENSLIKISGKKIRELFGSGVSINSVALYASIKGEMNDSVPKTGEIPSGVFEIPVLRYDLNKNGSVNDDDYFIAYVSGSSDWYYDTASQEFTYKINRYDDRRTYWLTVKGGSGASMGGFVEPQPPNPTPQTTFENNIYMRTPQTLSEMPMSHDKEKWLDWVWKRFTASKADTTISIDLPGINAGDAVSLRFTRGDGYAAINASLDANPVCSSCDTEWKSVSAWNKNPGNLTIRYSGSSNGYYELNGIYARYRRPISVSDAAGKLEIFSARETGTARYRISKSGTDLAYILRVPLDERKITLVTDTFRQEREYFFSDTGNMGTRYMVMLEKNIIDYSDSVSTVNQSIVNNDFQIRYLRNTSNKTDYLIVTHEDFLSAALKLAEHKKNVGFNSPKVVTLGDILNQFGGGNTDPAALRNFLLYAYRNWNGGKDLSYVVFFGSGHYDYKKISTGAPSFIPVPYLSNMICDDYYAFFDASRHPSSDTNEVYYFIGRLPAKSPSEAFDMVEKIRETEAAGIADFGAWRNRALLTADDDQQGDRRDDLASWHYRSSERTAAIITKNRPDVDLQKIYLFEYQWDERYYKPGATRALINEINSGAAIINWFGHGSANQLADEVLFAKSNIPALYNWKRYPIFTLFSCSIGKFDNPNDDCLASMLVRQPRAGAIAVLSSAREVYSWDNEDLALPFFEALFDPNERSSIGAAMKTAKFRFPNKNNRYYITLGDPSITLTAINRTVDLSIRDADDRDIAAGGTLKALQQVVIRGTVKTPSGLKDTSFSARRGGDSAFVSLTLFNPPDSALRKDGGKNTIPRYVLPGSPVFSAKVKVENGEFNQQFMLPMNLAFKKPGVSLIEPGVRLIAYAWKKNDTLTGAGSIKNLVFDGSDTGTTDDTTPPSISIRPVYNAGLMDSAGMFVKNRVTARLPLTLEIRVKDSSGINVVGSGPDEGLTMEVKGALSKRTINHLFQFEDFMQGVATVPFEENSLKSGTHELIISAQDLLGNVSKQSFTLEILEQAELKLDHVLNIPNPVRMGRETRFFYYHSNTQADNDMKVTVTIRVYSLGGRLLAVIRNPRNGEPWIPKDQRGNLLSPNVYLYQITASASDRSKSVKSKIKKLVVHPPR